MLLLRADSPIGHSASLRRLRAFRALKGVVDIA